MTDYSTFTDEELLRALKEAEAKDVLNNNLQLALKILLNAGYGAVGNQHFLYYKVENAEAITASGQLVNKWTHVRVNVMLNKILGTPDVNRTLAGDTDSLYLCLDDVVNRLGIQDLSDDEITTKLDEFVKTVMMPQVDKYTDELCVYMNAVNNKMVWEREVIASTAIFVRKKGYVMTVNDSEGVRFKDPKFKVVGLEAVKSSTPEWSRNYLKECYKLALAKDQETLQKRVKEIKKEFKQLSINDISIPRGVNNLEKYMSDETVYIKGTPKHVKAALNHNHLVKILGLNVPLITGGNKIKYIDLKRPNPINQDVIGFTWGMPTEFQLDKYVDRETIWETAFISPLQIFLEALKWTHEERISLESFFS